MISVGFKVPGTPIYVRDYLFRRAHQHPAAQGGALAMIGWFLIGCFVTWLLLR